MGNLASYMRSDRPHVIAEIGNNHEGDLGVARELIYAAKDAGVDSVKFQAIVPETLVSSDQTQRIAQLNKFCFNLEQFRELSEIASSLGLEFFTSVFDLGLIPGLGEFQNIFKISSGDNTYTDLIEGVARTGKPTIISTGGMLLPDIDRLRESFLRVQNNPQNLALLHCVSNYPTLPEKANLEMIETLRHRYPDTVVGYSDHTLGNDACFLAAALGAEVIEKHFTMSHTYSDFRDHQLSADPAQMAELIKRLPDASALMGRGKSDADRSDLPMTGVRRMAIAKLDISAGETFSAENVSWTRIIEDMGISNRDTLYGSTASTDILSGQVIVAENIQR